MMNLAIKQWRALWLGGLPPRSSFALLFALACVAIATLVRVGLGAISPESAVFAPYYSATLVAALVGGASAGGLAALAGAIAVFCLFVPPDWKSHAFDIEELVSYFLFAGSSLVIIWAANSYRGLLRRLREEQNTRQLLNHELAHRIGNMLSIVQAMIRQTRRDDPAAFTKLNDRIGALAATSNLLIMSQWRGAAMSAIFDAEFAPYDASRFHLDGEDFECAAELATTLALIFHELTTNAVKYGALSAPQGRIALSWRRHDDRIDFDWVESGGPSPPPPAFRRKGFGTTLVNKGLQLFDGVVDMRFETAGLHCRLSLALPAPRQHHAARLFAKWPPTPRAASTSSACTTVR
jgi:two-component sensor histidine kinase